MKFTFENQHYVITQDGRRGYEIHDDAQDVEWPYVYVENTGHVLRQYCRYQDEKAAELEELADLQATQDDASYRGQ